MGWDIVVHTNHNLQITNLKQLAETVSERLQISISYGYFKQYKFSQKKRLIDTSNNYNKVILGRINDNNGQKRAVAFLYDEYYDVKQIDQLLQGNLEGVSFVDENLERSFMDDLNSMYKGGAYTLDIKHKASLCFTEQLSSISFFRDLLDISLYFSIRWFGFTHMFQKDNWDIGYQRLYKIRQNLQHYMTLFGGTEAIYFADQGPTQFAWNHNCGLDSWSEFKTYMQNKGYYDELKAMPHSDPTELAWRDKSIIVNIPNFFKNNRPLYPTSAILESFEDDFSDMSASVSKNW